MTLMRLFVTTRASTLMLRRVMWTMYKVMLSLMFALFRPLPVPVPASLVLSTRAFDLAVLCLVVVVLPDPLRVPRFLFPHIYTTIVVYMMVWKCSPMWIGVDSPVTKLLPTWLPKTLVTVSK